MSSTNTDSSSSTTSNTSPDTSSSPGSSVGERIRGAFHAAYGVGETIRGNAMDFVDSTLGTERSGHEATVRGRQETAEGVASMEGRHTVGTAPVDPITTTTQTETHTVPPAIPSRGYVEEPSLGQQTTRTTSTVPPAVPSRGYAKESSVGHRTTSGGVESKNTGTAYGTQY